MPVGRPRKNFNQPPPRHTSQAVSAQALNQPGGHKTPISTPERFDSTLSQDLRDDNSEAYIAPEPQIIQDIRRNVVGDNPQAPREILPSLPAHLAEVSPAWHGDTRPKVYRWEIPDNSNTSGYSLILDIINASSPAEARQRAIDHTVIVGANERPLTALEAHYVNTMEPVIVRDTSEVTLAHDQLLNENERLMGLNRAYRETKELFRAHGIDINNPQAFIDRVHSEAIEQITEHQGLLDAREQSLTADLVQLQGMLARTIDKTKFAPQKPYVAPEPDYSNLVVVVDDMGDAQRFPRLAGATFVPRDLEVPLTDEEQHGRSLVIGENGVIHEYVRQFASPVEREALLAFEQRVIAAVGNK